MRHLFSAPGEQALTAVLSRRPLLAFDFDGTLAPIVARPEDARVSAAVAQQLQRLSALRPVAVVTGRRVDDVTPRLRFGPQYVVGNHGAEDPGRPQPHPYEASLDALRTRLDAAAAASRRLGVRVEDKGLSLALHYRLARDPAAAQAHIAALLAGLPDDLASFGGKCVVNVIGANAPDKASAVTSLVERSGSDCAVFAGDDLNDEAVFERAPPGWLTIRIGRHDASAARFYLDGTAQVATLLQKMLWLLASRPG